MGENSKVEPREGTLWTVLNWGSLALLVGLMIYIAMTKDCTKIIIDCSGSVIETVNQTLLQQMVGK